MFATRLITCVVTLAALASVGWIYPGLPSRVPTHFNASFQPDAFGPKLFVWLPPAVMLLAALLPIGKAWLRRGTIGADEEGRDAAKSCIATLAVLALSTYGLRYTAPPPQRDIILLGAFAALAGLAACTMSRRYTAMRLAWPMALGSGLGLIAAGLIGCTLPFALSFLVIVIAIYGGLSIWSERTTVAWR